MLVGSQILLNVGVSQVVPVLPIFAAQMGLGATGIGLLISAPPLARLALNLPLGRLCDSVGRLPLMRYGTLVTATGAVGTGLFMPYGLAAVLPFRLLIGAGSGASMAGSSAMMADLTDRAPQHRATIMGFQSMVLSAVWVVGPAVGGYLAEWWGARNAFFIAGAGIGLCSIGYSFLPETLRRQSGWSGGRHGAPKHAADGEGAPAVPRQASSWDEAVATPGAPYAALGLPAGTSLWHAPNVQALAALSASSSVGQACFMAVITLHCRNMFEATAADLGVLFSLMGVSYVVGMPIGSWCDHCTANLVVSCVASRAGPGIRSPAKTAIQISRRAGWLTDSAARRSSCRGSRSRAWRRGPSPSPRAGRR